MSTLSQCVKKAGKALGKSDADAVASRRDALVKDGMAPDVAAKTAVFDYMQELIDERTGLAGSQSLYQPKFPSMAKWLKVASNQPVEADEGEAESAPEHVNNEGKPLDEADVYPMIDKSEPQKGQGKKKKGLYIPADGKIPFLINSDAMDIISHHDWLFPDVDINSERLSLFDTLGKAELWTKNEPKPEGIKEGYYKGPGNGVYVSTDEAAAKLAGWKKHASDQDRRAGTGNRDSNHRRVVLSLFDLSGVWSQPYEDAGYQVIRVDIQNGDDVMKFTAQYLNDNYDLSDDVFAILAACPCTDFASSGSKHFDKKDADGRTEVSKDLVKRTMQIIEYFRPQVWALENPVGRIERLTGLPPWRFAFNPHHFGDPYTKRTQLWGNFNPNLESSNVEPTEGSVVFTKSGGKSLETKNERSETPEGFAYSFFKANNALDMTPEVYLTSKYTNVAPAIREALQMGMSEALIEHILMENNWDFDGGEAQNGLVEAMNDEERLQEYRDEIDDDGSPAPGYEERAEEPEPVAQPTKKPKKKPTLRDRIKKNKQPKILQAPKPKPAGYGEGNKLVDKSAADAARAAILAKMKGQLNMGLDPELMAAGVTLAVYHIEAGARKFVDFANAMVADLGTGIVPYLQSFYESVRWYPGMDSTDFDSAESVKAAHAELQEEVNAERESGSEESDSFDGADEVDGLTGDIQPDGRGDGRSGIDPDGQGAGGSQSEPGDPMDLFGTPVNGKPRNNGGRTKRPRSANAAAGGSDSLGGRPDSTGGLYAEREGDESTSADIAQTPEVIPPVADIAGPITLANINEVKKQMPFLTEGQAEDVVFAEDRLSKPDGFGVLFTNGTGTGKTFTGLGIIKRMIAQGKGRILIAAPKQTIVDSWVQAANKFFNIPIYRLEDKKEAGAGVVITTYANMGDNAALMTDSWDAVVMDEAHYLTSSQKGTDTAHLDVMRGMTLKRDAGRARAHYKHYALWKEIQELEKSLDSYRKSRAWAAHEAVQKALDPKVQEMARYVREETAYLAGVADADKPRAIFLSATPYAYETSIQWSQEFLFDWGQEEEASRGYNEPTKYEKFMMTHFGYSMRYNKLTKPDAMVDTGLMQRAFNTWMKREGVLSGRALDSDYDYDRRFVKLNSAIGNRVDEALEWLNGDWLEETADSTESTGPAQSMRSGLANLREMIAGQFDYHSRMYFLEGMKARESIAHIKSHLALGRNVLVMHDYKKGGFVNPFIVSLGDANPKDTIGSELRMAYEAFSAEFGDLQKSFEVLPSVIETMQAEFPDIMVYNGDYSAPRRVKMQDKFNSDEPGTPRIIIAQGDAMREGVSIHDTTGKHPRVLVQLGMPVKPTASIQQEGRIYRTGQASHAMFRYFTIGTNWERYAFASKIAGRVGVAENLAMGEAARGLTSSFVDAYLEAGEYSPGFAGEGTGGKDTDKAGAGALTQWDLAKSFYFGSKKQGKGRGARGREQSEFFATPEPLGLKMVEWAGIQPGESVLEPSAGNGAIGRFFPPNTKNRAIELTDELASNLALYFDGEVMTGDFMEHNIVNKYDAIVMNPPFGVGAKQAAEHLQKAMGHLRDGGRIVALIPTGPAADKRFEELFYGENARKDIYPVGEFKLPGVTFERAGTSTPSRVVVLERQTDPVVAAKLQMVTRDYSDAKSIENLFDRIETVGMPDRMASALAPKVAPDAPKKGPRFTGMVSTRNGAKLYVANLIGYMGSKYGEFSAIAKKYSGHYIKQAARGFYKPDDGSPMSGVPTFNFPTEADRDAFLSDAESGLGDGAFRAKKKAPTITQTQRNGSLKNVDKNIRKAVMQTLARETPEESARILKNLEELTETAWAVTAIKGLAIREFFHLATEGKGKSALANQILNSDIWGKAADAKIRNASIIQAFQKGAKAVEAEIASYGNILTDNKKAEKSISTSMKNCDPSRACAEHCYDATGTGGNPNSIIKSEFLEWATEFYPKLIADRIQGQYNASALAQFNLALRLNDKGDLSKSQVALVNEMARRGIRMQIFSKRPELLRQVDPFHWRALSVDATNLAVAHANQDLQLAITLTDGMTDAMMLQLLERGRPAVVLPVNLKGHEWSTRALKEQWPASFKVFQDAICPVEAGKSTVKRKTSYREILTTHLRGVNGRKVITCTTCDKLGSHGCFFGSNQTEVARADMLGSSNEAENDRLAVINQIRLELSKLEKMGDISSEQSRQILEEIRQGGRALSADAEPGAAKVAGGQYSEGGRDNSGRGEEVREGAGGLTKAKVSAVVAKLSKSWAAAPPITVVQSIADLPANIQDSMARQGVDDVAGYFDRQNQAIYIVADGMQSLGDVQVTLTHEAVGHYGIETIMGKEGVNDFLREVDGARADPVIGAAYDYVNEMYPTASPIVKAAEVVAYISESQPKHNFVQKMVQMVRQLLRKLGFTVAFSNNDIIEALRRAKDNLQTGAMAHAGGGDGLFQSAYHGSPHRHNKFSTDKIGTGEGYQAYGWGLYFAQARAVAEHYRDITKSGGGTARRLLDGATAVNVEFQSPVSMSTLWQLADLVELQDDLESAVDALDILATSNNKLGAGNLAEEQRELVRVMRAALKKGMTLDQAEGQLYTVDVPENDELLDFDAPISEQPPGVRRKLRGLLDYVGANSITREQLQDMEANSTTGGSLYNGLSSDLGGDKAASLLLRGLGIPGHRFLDAFSKNQAPDVPEFSAWAGYYKGVDVDTASEVELAELQAEYDAQFNAEDTRTRNFVIYDDARVEITDTLFRATDKFKKWFGNSKIVDANGEPLVVYHNTTADFSAFQHGEAFGIHFGDAKQANDIMRSMKRKGRSKILEGERGIPVYLRMENPLRVKKDMGSWTIHYLTRQLMEQGALTAVEREDILLQAGQSWAAGREALSGTLEAKGYDGIIYPNRFEGRDKPLRSSPMRDSYIAFRPEQIKSAIGNNGEFDIESANILFRASGPGHKQPTFGGGTERETVKDWAVRKMQDKMQPLLKAQRAIEAAGGTLDDATDAYRAEEAFYGKTEEDLRKLSKRFLEPLAEAIARHNITQDMLDEYLMARHARERNAHIRTINPLMPDGGSGMTDQESRGILLDFRQRGLEAGLADAAQHVYALLQHQRNLKRDLQGDAITDAWEAKYQHYVPLKGVAADDGGTGAPKGRGFDVRGRESRRAMGRASRADSPIGYAIMDTTDAVIRWRKNEVGNVFLAMAQANPDQAYWEVFTEANPDKRRAIVKTAAGDVVKMVDVNMAGDKDNYFATKKGDTTYYIKLADKRLIHAMQNMGPEQLNMILRFMGTITRFLSSMSTSYNPEFMISNMARDLQTAILNVLAEQDLPQGKANNAMEQLAWNMVKGVPRAVRIIHASLYDKQLTGENARWQQFFDEFREDGAKTGWFDQKDVDGQAEDLARMIAVAQGGAAGKRIKYMQRVKDLVEHSNTAIENGVRLSAYLHAREAGLTRPQAASLAKNLTVNFNRKGEIGGMLSAAYMFANASIQGTANFVRTMATLRKDPYTGARSLNIAQKLGAVLVGGAFFLGMLNRMMSGDDDDGENWYDKVPQHVRERNIVLMKSIFGGPEGEYYTIPLPYGYNVFYNLGDAAERYLNSGHRSGAQLLVGLAHAAMGSFSPIGFEASERTEVALIKTIIPTVLSPVVQLIANENFYGAPIYVENSQYDKAPLADSALTRKSTKAHWAHIARFLNEATEGTDYRPGGIDISPDTLAHMFDFVSGSAGAFYSRVADSTFKAISGEEVPAKDIPFLRKVSGEVTQHEDQSRFYERRTELLQFDREFKSLKSNQERDAFRLRYNDKLKLVLPVKAADKEMGKLRKARRDIEDSSLPADVRKQRLEVIETKTNALIDKFNRRYMAETQ